MLPDKLKSPTWIFACAFLGILTIAVVVLMVAQNIYDSDGLTAATKPFLPPTTIPPQIIASSAMTVTSSNELNKTNGEIDESKNIYACPNEDSDVDDEEVDGEISPICNCQDFFGIFNMLTCFDSNQKLNRTDIKILKTNFTVDYASFVGNSIKVLKKDKILPGHEHTIKFLDFSKGEIRKIENGTFDKFVSLQSLYLSKNSLTTIHERILTKNLGKTLIDLDISHNPFTSISPKLFDGYDKLKMLVFNGNTIPSSNFFDGLTKLEILHCKDCNFSLVQNVDEKLFGNLKNLKELYLSGSNITSISKSISSLTNLEYLEISHTSIKSIEDCAFCELKNLRTVILHSNKNLSFIHENAFGSVSIGKARILKHFSISHCNLSILPEKLLNWENSQFISVGENSYTCNCSMKWLIDGVKNFPAHFDGYLTGTIECYNPPELNGKNFFTLSTISLCKNETTSLETTTTVHPPTKNQTHSIYWRLLVIMIAVFLVIIIGSSAGIYFYRKRVRDVQYQRHSDDEEDKTQDDFDTINA